MKICGPKYALCGLIISIWGIIQLVLLGVFFSVRSVALIEDIEINMTAVTSAMDFYTKVENHYTQNAYNCWIAACLYIATLLFSGHQFYMNSRTSLSV